MGSSTPVANADNTTVFKHLIQFNPSSQLPIKLSGNHNFTTWKAQIAMLLHGHDLYGHLDGSTPSPPTTVTTNSPETPNLEYKDWFHQDKLIQNALMPTLNLPWDQLHTSFANKSQTRIFSLRHHLSRLTKDTKSIAEYLREIRSLSDELATTCSPVSNEELMLLEHEIFLKHEDLKKTTTQVTSVVAQRVTNSSPTPCNNRRPPNNNNSWRTPNRQSNQNAYPHWRNFPNQSVQPPRVRCQLCDRFGHTTNVCRSRSHNHFEAKANFVAQTPPSDPWILDSGVSHHITSDATSLHNVQDFKGIEEVTMVNGNGIPITQTVDPTITPLPPTIPLMRDTRQDVCSLRAAQGNNPHPDQSATHDPGNIQTASLSSASIIDVNNAFLQGKFHEDVYMSQPPGYENLDHPDYCDNSLFVLHNLEVTIYVLIYVDDLILTGSNETLIQHVITSFLKRFSLKYLGLLYYFLGIEVYRDADGLFLSQSKYIQEVLHDTQMQDCKGVQSPMSTSTKLLLDDGAPKTDGKEYRSVFEYRVVASALSETNWITHLLKDLHVTLSAAPTILCDNLGVTYIAENPVHHTKMKHLEVDLHFVRNQVRIGLVRISHIHSADQLADPFTKPLSKPTFQHMLPKSRVVSSSLT
ncbi:uncharacterized protein LOC142162251 [Nicotiana tabacum]|uniref:Uncharacterized protein LOC142162251 n=1 Tax=Nicotiana tabacum TaxID=4097 RepID=A0AC58RPM6_TOBAC